MKRIFCICLFLIIAAAELRAQNMPQFNRIRLVSNKDFKQADSTVSQVSAYLLSVPISRDSVMRLNAAQFLMKWMEGTGEYTFVLNESSTRSFINNTSLMAVYMAALCKAALQHKPGADTRLITLEGIKHLITYINNPANNVKGTPELRELSDANNKGELESFLNF